MNRNIVLSLFEPFGYFVSEDASKFAEDITLEIDLFEGTVELPSGKVVAADSFVRVDGSLRKFMQDWQDNVSGQHNPIYNDPIKELKRAILYRLYSLRIESESPIEQDAYNRVYKIGDEIL